MGEHTPLRNVRISDDEWNAAKAVAASRNETLTKVVRDALARYVKRHSITTPPD